MQAKANSGVYFNSANNSVLHNEIDTQYSTVLDGYMDHKEYKIQPNTSGALQKYLLYYLW